MPTTVPCLWFDGQAEQAAEHYTAIFPNSAITAVTRHGPAGPGPEGSVLTVDFHLDGQRYLALNGGPGHTFSWAVSFQVLCETQEEVDHYWSRLSDGGRESRCGWLEDRFGLSWQVVPTVLPTLIGDPDPARAQRAMQAMMSMVKVDVAALQRAADGVPA